MDKEMMEFFFKIHNGDFRGGPGSDISTEKAYNIAKKFLGKNISVLDIGAGSGFQTKALKILVDGKIIALDTTEIYLEKIKKEIGVETVNCSMYNLDRSFRHNTFNLIWSEGAIYIMGLANGLKHWKLFLKKGGIISFSHISWIQDNPSMELLDYWEANYPQIRTLDENKKIIDEGGYEIKDYFILPSTDWTENYYDDMADRLKELEKRELSEKEKMVINMHWEEIEIYKKYGEYYGYVFFIISPK
ncbi:MAG: hypothetical protein B6227_05780 [Fusobacteriia bacterium 4572_74]|nr:MAG: hypothetical protein B6227_05780 [Fusobacteriia bacterium 4572_74]